MQRLPIALPVLVLSLLCLIATAYVGVQAAAQNDSSSTADHPLVGAWLFDLGEDGGRLLTFSADGTVVFADADGTTGQGTWEVRGDSTAAFTTYRLISDPSVPDSSFIGYSILSGEIAVEADGRWIGDLVVAQTERDGVIAFSNGPFTLSASPIPVLAADQLMIGMPVTGLPSVATPAP